LALGFLATKARSDVLTLSLPADLVSRLVDALYQLRSTTSAERSGTLDELASQLAAGGPLKAQREVLRELLTVAIDEAGDRVSVASTRLLRGLGSGAEVRTEVERLSGLLELLEDVGDGAAGAAARGERRQ
jgi:hypothetical protein